MSNCTSCGSPIPDGQGKSCSMCYGDPHHGSDGYYQAFLDAMAWRELELERARHEEAQDDR